MITANRRLLARVCGALLESCGLEGFWTEDGPSALATVQRSGPSDALTSSQRMTLEFAWTLWLGESHLKISDLLHEIDDEALVKIGTLLVGAAYGERGVADWLAIERADDAALEGPDEDPPVSH